MAGPCTPWITVDEVIAHECGCDIGESDPDVLQPSLDSAIENLFILTGSRYSGECEATFRPCDEGICSGPWNRYSSVRRGCGCAPLDRIPLAGSAREVLEVTIDGEVVDPATYEVREGMWLVRINDPADPLVPLHWPSCEDSRRPLTEEGTFGFTYTYGIDPPSTGLDAAAELACAIFEACSSSDPGACRLPQGVTQIVRQGVTFNLNGFAAWGLTEGIWRTGMPFVDAFLNGVASKGKRAKRPQVWSPDLWKYPRPMPSAGS